METNDKNQPVVELTALFKKPKEEGLKDEEINNAVANALQEADDEIIKERREKLTLLFNSQMGTLASRGCPQDIINILKNKFDEVLLQTTKLDTMEMNHIPFVPVIPIAYLGIYGLISMLEGGEEKQTLATDSLNPNLITDNITPPKEPYFIIDVSSDSVYHTSVRYAINFLHQRKEHSTLTFVELLALYLHCSEIRPSYLNCAGSYCDENSFPVIFKDENCLTLKKIDLQESCIKFMAYLCRLRV